MISTAKSFEDESHQAEDALNLTIQELVWINFVGNGLLLILKLTIGIMYQSTIIIADAFTTSAAFLLAASLLLSRQVGDAPPDDSHQYGHGNLALTVPFIVNLVLIAGASYLAYVAIFHGQGAVSTNAQLGLLIFTIPLISFFVNGLLTRFLTKENSKWDDPGIRTMTRDNRIGMVSSGICFIVLLMELFDLTAMCRVGIITISLVLLITCVDILVLILKAFTDVAPSPELTRKIRLQLLAVSEVKKVEILKLRHVGRKLWLEARLAIDKETPIKQTNEIEHHIKQRVSDLLNDVEEIILEFVPVEEE